MLFHTSILCFIRLCSAAHTGYFVPLTTPDRLAQFQDEHEAKLHQATNTTARIVDSLRNIAKVTTIDKYQTAQFMIYLIGVMGMLYVVTPGFLFNVFGGQHSALNHRLVQTYGAGVLGVIVMMFAVVLNKDLTLAEAYQLSEVPWIIESCRKLWQETLGCKPVGYNKRIQILRLTLSSLFLYTMTQHHPTTAMQVATALWSLVGLFVVSQPQAAASSLFGHFSSSMDATSIVMIRMIGFNMLAHAGLAGAMLYGCDPLTAFGFGYASWFIKVCIMQIVTRDFAKADLDAKQVYFWIGVHGTVVTMMLLM